MPLMKSNMKVADAVLALIENMIPEENYDISCEPYQNCREHGWSLQKGFDNKVAFSEFRRSDDIVVYMGRPYEFAMAENVPNERVYGNARFFGYNKHYEAAVFIYEWLMEDHSKES